MAWFKSEVPAVTSGLASSGLPAEAALASAPPLRTASEIQELLVPHGGRNPLGPGDSVRKVNREDLGEVVQVDSDGRAQVRWPPRRLAGGGYSRRGPLEWVQARRLRLVCLPLPLAREDEESGDDGGPAGLDLEVGDKVRLEHGALGGNCLKEGEIGEVIEVDETALQLLRERDQKSGPPYKIQGPRGGERGGKDWFSPDELRCVKEKKPKEEQQQPSPRRRSIASPAADSAGTELQREQIGRYRPTSALVNAQSDEEDRKRLEAKQARCDALSESAVAAAVAVASGVSQLPLPASSGDRVGHIALVNTSGVPKSDIEASRTQLRHHRQRVAAGFANFHDLRGYVRNPEEVLNERTQSFDRGKWVSRGVLVLVALGVVVFIITFLFVRNQQGRTVEERGAFNSSLLYLEFNASIVDWSDNSFRDAVARECAIGVANVHVVDKWPGSVHVLFRLVNLVTVSAVAKARSYLQSATVRDVQQPSGKVPTAATSAFVRNGLVLVSPLTSGDGQVKPPVPPPVTAQPTGSPFSQPTLSPTHGPTVSLGVADRRCGQRVVPGELRCSAGLDLDEQTGRCYCPVSTGQVCVYGECGFPVWECKTVSEAAGVCPTDRPSVPLSDCKLRCVRTPFCSGVLHDTRRPGPASCQLAMRDGLGLSDWLKNSTRPQQWCELKARSLPRRMVVERPSRSRLGGTATASITLEGAPTLGNLTLTPAGRGLAFDPPSVTFQPSSAVTKAVVRLTIPQRTEYDPAGLRPAAVGWPLARDTCHSIGAGWRLCTHAEYCPQGNGTEPRPGRPAARAWGAVGGEEVYVHGRPSGVMEPALGFPTPPNATGDWVALGSAQPSCALHSGCCGGIPDWTDWSTDGVVHCCRTAESPAYYDATNGTAAQWPATGYTVRVDWNVTGPAWREYTQPAHGVVSMTEVSKGWLVQPDLPPATQGQMTAVRLELERAPGEAGQLPVTFVPRARYAPPSWDGPLLSPTQIVPPRICLTNATDFSSCLDLWASPEPRGSGCADWMSPAFWQWVFAGGQSCRPFTACLAHPDLVSRLCVKEPVVFEPPRVDFGAGETDFVLGVFPVKSGLFEVYFELPALAPVNDTSCLGPVGACSQCWAPAGNSSACPPACGSAGECESCRDCVGMHARDYREMGVQWEENEAALARCLRCFPLNAAQAERDCLRDVATCSALANASRAAELIDLPPGAVLVARPRTLDSPTFNVATAGSATQSSLPQSCGQACGPDSAIDGTLSGNVSVSNYDWPSDKEPWWRLKLPRAVAVRSVVLYNRVDCCRDRMFNLSVQLRRGGAAVWSSHNLNPSYTAGPAIINPQHLTANPFRDGAAAHKVIVCDEVLVSKFNSPDNPLSDGIHATLNLAEVNVLSFEDAAGAGAMPPFSSDRSLWLPREKPDEPSQPAPDQPDPNAGADAPVYPPLYEPTVDQVLWNVAWAAKANQSSTARGCAECSAAAANNGLLCPRGATPGNAAAAGEHTLTEPGLRAADGTFSQADRAPWLSLQTPVPFWLHSVVIFNRFDCDECRPWLRDLTVTFYWGTKKMWSSSTLNPANALGSPDNVTAATDIPYMGDLVRISKTNGPAVAGLEVTLSVSEVELYAFEPLGDGAVPPVEPPPPTATRTMTKRPPTDTKPVPTPTRTVTPTRTLPP